MDRIDLDNLIDNLSSQAASKYFPKIQKIFQKVGVSLSNESFFDFTKGRIRAGVSNQLITNNPYKEQITREYILLEILSFESSLLTERLLERFLLI